MPTLLDALFLATGFTGALTLVWLVRLVVQTIRPVASVTPHFSPGGGCTDILVREIGAAHREALVLARGFDSRPITQALVDAKMRGVNVEVILDAGNEKSTSSDLEFLRDQGLVPLIDAEHAVANNRVVILDGKTIVLGSFDFTRQAETDNAENLLVIRGMSDLIQAYRKDFQHHKSHARQAGTRSTPAVSTPASAPAQAAAPAPAPAVVKPIAPPTPAPSVAPISPAVAPSVVVRPVTPVTPPAPVMPAPPTPPAAPPVSMKPSVPVTPITPPAPVTLPTPASTTAAAPVTPAPAPVTRVPVAPQEERPMVRSAPAPAEVLSAMAKQLSTPLFQAGPEDSEMPSSARVTPAAAEMFARLRKQLAVEEEETEEEETEEEGTEVVGTVKSVD